MDDEAKENLKLWIRFFKDFRYKPNFKFEIMPDLFMDLPKVKITMSVFNSRKWPVQERIEIYQFVTLDHYASDEYAREYMRWQLQEMEMHELEEWFRHKGEWCFDPHKVKVDAGPS